MDDLEERYNWGTCMIRFLCILGGIWHILTKPFALHGLAAHLSGLGRLTCLIVEALDLFLVSLLVALSGSIIPLILVSFTDLPDQKLLKLKHLLF